MAKESSCCVPLYHLNMMLLCILSRKYTKTSESEKINFTWHALKVGPLQDLSRLLKRLCHWAAFQRKNPIKSKPSAFWKNYLLHILNYILDFIMFLAEGHFLRLNLNICCHLSTDASLDTLFCSKLETVGHAQISRVWQRCTKMGLLLPIQ